MYSQNYDHTTMHYYMHFYCMITYNLLHVFLLHVMTILLHAVLNVTKSRKQVLALNTHTHASQWVRTDLNRRATGK